MKLANLERQMAASPQALARSATDLTHIKAAVRAALAAVENATQLCLAAGQLLNEVQERLPWGEFQPWIGKYLPEISYETANRWARAAANILKHLPPPTIDIPVSEILSLPASELPPDAQRYKQQWFDFTQDKTIKECLGAVLVGGDEAHRIDRALNGRMKGGTNLHDDRKDFPLFAAQLLQKLSGHIAHWKGMNSIQRSEIEQIFRAAILGHGTSLKRKSSPCFPYKNAWPKDLAKLLSSVCKQRLKGGNDE